MEPCGWKKLADECIRSINNTTEVCTCRRDTCMEKLKGQISVDFYKECSEFIERVRLHRHRTTLERHLKKFDQLNQQTRGGHSSIGGHSKHQQNHTCMAQRTPLTSDALTLPTSPTWPNNISNISRNNRNNDNNNSEVKQMAEESIGSPPYRSPNFPAGPWTQFCYSSPKHPHGEYISAME